MRYKILSLASILFLGACVRTVTPPPARAPSGAGQPRAGTTPAGAQGAGDSAAAGRSGASGTPSPRPYDRVITPGAITRRGMFSVHKIGDKLFFEIPRKEMYKDMLIV